MCRFNLKKILISVMSICLIGAVIFTIGINADAVEGNTKEVLPTFQVAVQGEQHREAWIGEEIEIKGTITPSEMNMTNVTTDIVLAIDVSKSMGESAGIECTNRVEKEYCETCKASPCNKGKPCKWQGQNKDWTCIVHNVMYTNPGQPPSKCSNNQENSKHNIVKELYCNTHNTSNHHDNGTTKLDELKLAIIDFVDTNKSNIDLNLSIITYSKKALIKKQQNIESFNLNKDAEAIKNIVNSIQVENEIGTNTGETIRKSNYILNKSKALSKKFVLLTDGLPTYYSKNSNGGENTDISDEDPDNATGFGGDGKKMTNETKGYAVNMGKNIKSKGYDVVTISYGMSEVDGEVIEEIHSVMSDEKNNYLKADGENIKEVFSSLTTIIDDGYTTKPITLNLNLDTESGLSVIQNGQVVSDGKVTIPQISYNKVETGNIYKAKPVDFQFSLIGAKKLQELNIFEKSELIIQLGDMFIKCGLELYTVTVKEQLPNINVGYTKLSPSNPMVDEPIEITYEVLLQEFEDSNLQETVDNYVIDDVKLKFDLGEKLIPVSNIEIVNEGSNEYYLTIPPVNYILDTESGMYKPEQERIEVTFQVKAEENGIIDFGVNSSLEYTGLGDVKIVKKLYTPILCIEKAGVMEHGPYGGAVQWHSDGSNNYIYNSIEGVTEDKTFAKSSTLTMAGKFRLSDVNSTLVLDVDNGLSVVGKPTIYVQDTFGKLNKLGEMNTETLEFKFSQDISEDNQTQLDNRSIIVVMYNIILPNNEVNCENNMYLFGESGNLRNAKIVNINVKEELPDLF